MRRWMMILAAVTFTCVSAHAAVAQPVIRVPAGGDLQAALDNAPRDSIVMLEPGRHQGPVTIRTRLALHGHGSAHIAGSGKGSVVTVAAAGAEIQAIEISDSGRDFSTDDAGVLVLGNDVQVRNLSLHGNLHGIYVRGALRVRIRDNKVVGLGATQKIALRDLTMDSPSSGGIHLNPPKSQSLMGNGIHLFNANEAVVSGNLIEYSRDGIYVAFTSNATFDGNDVHDCRYGIHYMYSHNNIIEKNRLWRNVAGPALMFSHDLRVSNNILRDHGGFRAYGLLLQDIEKSRFENNEVLGNRVGMRLQSCNDNVFTGNHIGGNLGGMTLDSASRDNVFVRNVFGFNLHQVELTGPTPPNDWSADGVGNQWYDAMPLDLNGDGISEWPHHEVDLMGDLREQFPPVQLLIGSPGIRILEWAMKRAPVPRLRYVTDPHPLTRGFTHAPGATHQ